MNVNETLRSLALGPIAPLNASHSYVGILLIIVREVRRRSVERAFLAQKIVTLFVSWQEALVLCPFGRARKSQFSPLTRLAGSDREGAAAAAAAARRSHGGMARRRRARVPLPGKRRPSSSCLLSPACVLCILQATLARRARSRSGVFAYYGAP